MTSEWREARLGDVLTLKRGYDLPKHSREPGDIPIVSSSGVSGSHSEAKVAGPGVVTGRYGTIGQVFYVDGHFWPLNTTLYVQDFKGNRPRYIKYLLETLDFHQFSDKAAVPGVNRNHLHEALMLVPPPSEQERIETVLAMLEWRIDNLRQTNTTLEAIAQALFKSWFVDFDPVHAKAEGREPEGMDAATAALFPSEFEDSELGPIPKGWRVGTLLDLVELKYGKPLKASERREGAVPVYGSGGITGSHDSALVSSQTIIVGRKGTVGALYWQSAPCFPIDTVFFVVPKKSLHFSYYAMQRMGLEHLNTDAAVPGLNRDNAYRQSVVIPPDPVLQMWDKLADAVRQRIDESQTRSRTLAITRDTLLPRLISGKLRLPEAESILQDTTA